MFERYRQEAADFIAAGDEAEVGLERLQDMRLLVTVRTFVPDCSAEMVNWWFGYMRTPADYALWHPEDHVWMDWDERFAPGCYVGASHLVHERIGGRLQKLRIHFYDPTLLFGTLVAERGYQLAICGRTGMLERPLDVGYLVHLVRDSSGGCEMLSRFWLGDVGARSPRYALSAWLANRGLLRRRMAPDMLGRDLVRHCSEEMGNFASFLPQLWERRHEEGS